MKNRRIVRYGMLLVVALALVACGTPAPTATPVPGPFTVTVLYTNDGWGYTEPCACDPAIGGLARRAAYIRSVREQVEHVLLVDAGDSLLTLQRLGDLEQGRVLVEAFNEMGYDAVALGGMDFRMGLDVLREQIQAADFAVLSANTLDPQTEDVFDEAYTIVEQEERRIALIGLTDPKTVQEVTQGQALVTEPVETLMRIVDRIRDDVDVIVVLSHLGFMFDVNLHQVVPDIDLIVSGRDTEVYHPPITASGPVIVSAGSRGEYIGRVDLHFDVDANLVNLDAHMQVLDDTVADDPEMRQWMAQTGMIPASALKPGTTGQFSP
jgi:2',3'-cyclic-nucleotide 2'-phosphodiesterase (5'-nucleotidase family)